MHDGREARPKDASVGAEGRRATGCLHPMANPSLPKGRPGSPGVDMEFYGPFAHIPGRLEWCRIRSPTHGVFDTCIVIEQTTSDPVTVYVNADNGEAFMHDRFPECTTIRVPADALQMLESDGGHRLDCHLTADDGPLRAVHMTFQAAHAKPRQVPYGGQGRPVWGSRYTCDGIDLELDADVVGKMQRHDGARDLRGSPGIITVGSMGKLTLLD